MNLTKTENIMNANQELLNDLLKNNVVEVTFTKANGQKRVLKATLQEKYLPVLTFLSRCSSRAVIYLFCMTIFIFLLLCQLLAYSCTMYSPRTPTVSLGM